MPASVPSTSPAPAAVRPGSPQAHCDDTTCEMSAVCLSLLPLSLLGVFRVEFSTPDSSCESLTKGTSIW